MDVRLNKNHVNNFKGDLEQTASLFLRVLYILATISIVSQFTLGIVFGIKAVFIFVLSVFVARETEIFFTSQKSNIDRAEVKEMLKTTRPEITGLIFALMLPVGTPLFVVAVGAFVSIFIGKMVFGGYSFNVFNPAIVGRLFVSIAWPALVTINFPKTIDNYILQKLFSADLSGEMLSPLMELQANGIVSLENMKSIPELLFTPNYGMLFSVPAVVYIGLLIFFLMKKVVDLRPLLFAFITSLLLLLVVAIGFNMSGTFVLFHYLAGGFFFVTLLMMTDPFTKPYSTVGTLYYAVIFTVVYALIRFLGKDADGVLYALLFANLFVPLLNKKTAKSEFAFSAKSVIAVVTLLIVLIGTGLFINTVLDQRITSKQIVVNEYDKE